MISGKVLKSFVLFSTVFLVFSCSQKFPVPVSENQGILVIPQEGFNETEKLSFGYNYLMRIVSNTGFNDTIKVYPSVGKKFFITKCIPSGEYQITGMTAVGVRSRSNRADKLKISYDKYLGPYFTIKPNKITILEQKFIVSKKKLMLKRWRQSWKFEFIDDDYRLNLINELKKLKNFGHWTINNQ